MPPSGLKQQAALRAETRATLRAETQTASGLKNIYRIKVTPLPSSYTSLNYHIVFSTKYRKPLLVEAIREDVYKYINGIIQNKEGQLIEIGGIEDHIHILTSCSPKLALADFIRDVKANASKWINEQPRSDKFAWQSGYGAFTVSVSQVEVVRQYIRHQAEHHKQQSFSDEFQALLSKHHIAFDEERLFEDEFHG